MASKTARVTLTRSELVRLRDLQNIAWGKDKTYAKLSHAIEKIDYAEKEETTADGQ